MNRFERGLGAALLVSALLAPAAATATGLTGAETISSIAGTGSAGNSGNGLPATLAQLNPWFVAADRFGNVYFSDRSSHVVRKIAGGVVLPVAGTGSAGFSGDDDLAITAALNAPAGLAVDPQGNVYISDRGNNRIRKITVATGIISTIAGNGGSGFSGDGADARQATLGAPLGIAVGRDGTVYIPDSENFRLRRVRPDGVIETIAGNGQQSFGNDPAGDGGPALQASFSIPVDAALDAAGNVYIADLSRSSVRRLDIASNVLTTYAGGGLATAEGTPARQFQFISAWNVAVDGFGNLYVSERGTNAKRVRKVDATTLNVTTAAGSGAQGYAGDGGAARDAHLYHRGIAADLTGNLYIADENNYRVRKVTAAPLQSDIALTKSCSPNPVDVNTNFTCVITVTNLGPGGAAAVQVTDTVSPAAGVTLVSATPSVGSCPTATPVSVVCNLGAIAPGAANAESVALVLKSSQPGTITDVAAAAFPGLPGDPQQINDSASFQTVVRAPGSNADVAVSKTAAAQSVRIGQQVRYTIRVDNNGPDRATQVKVTDIAGTIIQGVQPQPGWVCGSAGSTSVECTRLELAAGASSTIDVTFVSAVEGQICNFGVTVRADQDDGTQNNNSAGQICVDVARSFALAEFVAFSRESTMLGSGSRVRSGALGANARQGTIAATREVVLAGPMQLAADTAVVGETVWLDNVQVPVVRSVDPVQLLHGATALSQGTAGALPILTLPALQPANPDPAASGDVSVAANQTRTLSPGRYHNLTVGSNGTVQLLGYSALATLPNTPRGYDFARIQLASGAKLVFLDYLGQLIPSRYRPGVTVRVSGRVLAGSTAVIGQSDPAGNIKAKHIVFHVGGSDLYGVVSSGPTEYAVNLGSSSDIRANFYAPNGTILINNDARAVGAFVGKAFIGTRADLTLESAF